MKITLFTTDAACSDIISVKVAHITMFKDNKLEIRFISEEEQIKFINVCIKHYVLFECQGQSIKIIPEPNNFQRVRYRFDS